MCRQVPTPTSIWSSTTRTPPIASIAMDRLSSITNRNWVPRQPTALSRMFLRRRRNLVRIPARRLLSLRPLTTDRLAFLNTKKSIHGWVIRNMAVTKVRATRRIQRRTIPRRRRLPLRHRVGLFPCDEDLVNETCEDENNGQRFSSRREVRKNARISRRSPATSTTRCVWFDTQRKHVKHHLIYSEQLICDGHPLIVTKRSCLRVSAIAVFLSSRERFPVEHVSQSETHTQSERAKIRPRKKSFKQWLGCLIIADRPNRRLSVSTYTCFSSSITDRRARGRVRIFAYWRW